MMMARGQRNAYQSIVCWHHVVIGLDALEGEIQLLLMLFWIDKLVDQSGLKLEVGPSGANEKLIKPAVSFKSKSGPVAYLAPPAHFEW